MSQEVFLYGASFSTFVRTAAIICEEKNITYQTGTVVNQESVAMHSAKHLTMHPFGKIPVLLHGDRILVETAAIGRYLDAIFSPQSLQGSSPWQMAQCDQWCSLISIYVYDHLVKNFMLELAFPGGDQGKPRMNQVMAGRDSAREALAIVARQLGNDDYLLGDEFTMADAFMAPILAYNSGLPDDLNLVAEFTQLAGYTERLKSRPSGKRVLTSLEDALASA